MIRHEKPGQRTRACTHTRSLSVPTSPFSRSMGRGGGKASLLSPHPLPKQADNASPHPLQPPALIREAAAGTEEPEQTLTKRGDTETHSKDTPGAFPAPPTPPPPREGAGGPRAFDSQKDNTKKKMKKGQQSTVSPIGTDRAAWGAPGTMPPI